MIKTANKIKTRRVNRQKAWLTSGLKNACHKKNNLYRRFIKSRSDETEQCYKKHKNKLTSILRNAEKTYNKGLLDDQKQNMKETWKILNTVINKCQSKSTYPDYFVNDGIRITDKSDIANGFNTFFANIAQQLATKIDQPVNCASVHDYLKNRTKNSMFLNPISEVEVINTVNACKNKASMDSNDINMVIIKQVIQPITRPLTAVFNKSFETGIFPSNMKVAKVIPIFKNGSRAEFNNYRPISLLSQFSKILEQLYSDRLEQFIDNNNVLSKSQYGFRPSMSTSHALLDLVEEISTSLDNKKHTLGVFIDLKRHLTQ